MLKDLEEGLLQVEQIPMEDYWNMRVVQSVDGLLVCTTGSSIWIDEISTGAMKNVLL